MSVKSNLGVKIFLQKIHSRSASVHRNFLRFYPRIKSFCDHSKSISIIKKIGQQSCVESPCSWANNHALKVQARGPTIVRWKSMLVGQQSCVESPCSWANNHVLKVHARGPTIMRWKSMLVGQYSCVESSCSWANNHALKVHARGEIHDKWLGNGKTYLWDAAVAPKDAERWSRWKVINKIIMETWRKFSVVKVEMRLWGSIRQLRGQYL